MRNVRLGQLLKKEIVAKLINFMAYTNLRLTQLKVNDTFD